MNDDSQKTIYNTLVLKDTEELLEIWKTNDRVEWMEITFEVIQQILQERQVDLPTQNEPIFEHINEKVDETSDLNTLANDYEHPDNSPVFYNPEETLQIASWLDKASRFTVWINVILGIPLLFAALGLVSLYFVKSQFANWVVVILTWLITVIIVGLITGLGCLIYYSSFKALASILKILMEMEFNSRGIEESHLPAQIAHRWFPRRLR